MKNNTEVHKDIKIGSKKCAEISEDVQKRSYESKDDGRYQTSNKEEREKLINLGNVYILFL